ncbi:MAG TPA: hypothetical protein VEL03_13945 [Streptosporangiaceae bacterium]|nr:hypothetical protein [Streptosporangiaceae bacterium]
MTRAVAGCLPHLVPWRPRAAPILKASRRLQERIFGASSSPQLSQQRRTGRLDEPTEKERHHVSDVDRFPTWILLLAAIALVSAVVLRFMVLDRGSNPRRLWLILLALWLVVVGLAAAGVFRTWSDQNITPNEGLLVLADVMAGLLVISVPVGRAVRRLTDDQLRQLRGRGAMLVALGRRQFIVVMALMLGTMAALLAGESALAAKLPGPPAVVACQDYTTWILAPGNGTMPPSADQTMLAQAARIAPPGRLRLNLAALAADVQSAISDGGTAQGILEYSPILSEESSVNLDCKSVPVAG